MRKAIDLWNCIIFMAALSLSLSLSISFVFAESPADGSFVNTSTPEFDWDYVHNDSLTYELVISDDSGFSSDIFSESDIEVTNYQLIEGDGLDDGEYFWRIIVFDDGNETDEIGNYSFIVDTAAPEPGIVIINGGDMYSSSDELVVEWEGFSDDGSGIDVYFYDFLDGSGSDSGTSTQETEANISGLGEGEVTVYVWARDNAGNIGSAVYDTIVVDTIPPEFDNWGISPGEIRYDYDGDVEFSVDVIEENLAGLPQCRYWLENETWESDYSEWQDMDNVEDNRYRFVVNEDWGENAGYDVVLECNAVDEAGNSGSGLFVESILRNEHPPEFVNVREIKGIQDQELSFLLEADDPDGGELSFSTEHPDIEITRVGSKTAEATWTPVKSDVGVNVVNFSVNDGKFTTTEEFIINVSWVNDPPELNEIDNIEAYLHESFTKTITATDPDNEVEIEGRDYQFGYFSADIDWIRTGRELRSSFNYSSKEYVGFLNFTPLKSHKGVHNVTFTITDEEGATDSQYVLIRVGYCGDGICDAEYEDCETCPEDCGRCSVETSDEMAIITESRNCLYTNITISVYKLFERATCSSGGRVVDGKDVCEPIEGATVDVYLLKDDEWQEKGSYLTGEEGKFSFVPQEQGSYKLKGEYQNYEKATQQLEIRECIDVQINDSDDEVEEDDGVGDEPDETAEEDDEKEDEKEPDVDVPGQIDDGDDEGREVQEAPLIVIIIYYVIVPLIFAALIVACYFYYQKEKNNNPLLLKFRIWKIKKEKQVKNMLKRYYLKARDKVGF